MIRDALVSASTGVMNSVIEKLAIFMGEEYKMQKNIQREVAFLKDELGSMNAVLKELANMEEELDLQTMVWRNQVMGMAFDIEDCIDDFMHQVGENSNIGDVGFIGRIAQYINALRVRHNFGNQLQQLKTRVKDTSERRKRYKLDESASSSTSVAVDPRITALYTELGNLVGMDGPKEEVNKLLNEEGASGQHLRVVSIVGFGGLGKTTLANDIYSEIEVGVGAQYDCKAFVSVSQKPDIMKLLSMIISDVKMPEPTNAYQLKGLIDSIKKYLANKRYFFVIDDIWGASAWEVLRLAFPDNEGSKLITTTRIETVAAVCCNNLHQFIYKMKPLDIENSKKLFLSRFGDFYPQSFLDISGEILQKCGGLPLAIISIASLLASHSNRSMEQWKYVCYSLSTNLRTNPSLEGMRQVLKLSYNNLPYHLKICLLYMGMYPEDYVIRKEKLVSQWLVEGFIGKIQDRDAEDVAGSYFNELVNRSMIQPMETGYYGEILCCKVHDMILDLIRLKSEEDNFMRVVENSQGMSTALQSKVRRLALHFEENQETEEIVASLSMSHIRSLTVFGKSSFKLPISELKFIRVLNLVVEDNGIDLTPIRQLFQLTYLDVGNAQLPTRIRDLQRLETLKCTSDIPSDVIDLPCLLHLHIRGGRLPDGICKMKSLRTLHSFHIDNNSADNLRGLGELKNIRDLTIICHNGGTLDGTLKGLNQRGILDVFWSSMSKLVNYNLRSLGLFVDFLSTKAIAGCSSFTCHTESNLEIFDCRDWMFPRVPSWIGQHHKLSMLELQVMKLTQDGIDLLSGLPNLTNLLLWIRKSPEESIVTRGGVAAFPVLANFRIWCFAPCFTFQEGAMPSVQNLELRFHLHAMMRRQLPVNGVEHLVRLRKVQARIHFGDADTDLGSRVTGVETILRNAISAHPRQPSITVDVKGDKPPYYGVCELLDDEDVNHADLGPKIHQMALEKLLKWKDRARSSVQPKA